MPSKGACSKPTEKKSPVTRFPAARAPRRTAPDAPLETRGFLPRVTRTSRDARRLFPGISRDERRGYRVASQGGTLTSSSSSRVFSPRVTLLFLGPRPLAFRLRADRRRPASRSQKDTSRRKPSRRCTTSCITPFSPAPTAGKRASASPTSYLDSWRVVNAP